MNYRSILTQSYRLTKEHPGLHWFGFWPALLDILVGGTMLFYQVFATLHHVLRPLESILQPLRPLLDFARNNFAVSTIIAVLAIIIVLLRVFVPVVCNAGLIYAVNSIKRGHPLSGGRAFTKGIWIFLPLFELTLITSFFSFHTMLVELGFSYRNLPWRMFEIVAIPLLVFGIISLLISLALVYAEFYLILEGQKIRKAIHLSFWLVMQNLRHTIIVGLLMLTIGLRILISVILVLAIPVAVVWLFAAILIHLPLEWALGLSSVFSLVLLYYAGRLLGAVNVLITGAWTLTFLELRAQQEQEREEMVELNNEED